MTTSAIDMLAIELYDRLMYTETWTYRIVEASPAKIMVGDYEIWKTASMDRATL